MSPAKQEAAILEKELKALDEHEAETRRLLNAPDFPPVGTFLSREVAHRDLTAAVVERSRRLVGLVLR